mgnify:CR=1 FL=1
MTVLAAAIWAVWFAAPSVDPIGVDEARKSADRIDERIGQMKVDLDRARQSVGVVMRKDLTGIERRLADAQTQMMLEDPWRAAVVLLDVVERPENRSHPRYSDAVFQLAEALRRSRNFRTARGYYEQLLTQSRGERLQEVVEGLLEISTETRDYSDVELYLDHLRRGSGLSGPQIDYLHGRVLFRRAGAADRALLEQALARFESVPASSPLAPKAGYFAAVTRVRLEDYSEAIAAFERTLELIPEGDARARQLTRLSLGRLYQEVGRIEDSIAAYSTVPANSPYYADTLYERAWAHVAAANRAADAESERTEYLRALEATELLMAMSPDAGLFASARILQGNLEIRLGAPDTAYDTFESVIDRYGRDKRRLDNFIARQEDTQAFFEQLVYRTAEGESELPQPLPELAITWVLEQESMDQVVDLERDLLQSEKNLRESRELLEVMTAALAGEQQYRMFPGLGPVRDQTLSIQNRWLSTHLELLQLERRAVVPTLTAAELRPVARAHADVERLAREIERLPETTEEVAKGREEVRRAYERANLRAYKLTFAISSLRAELLAVEGWLNRGDSDLSARERRLLEARIAETQNQVAGLENELELLLEEIRSSAVLAASDSGATRSAELSQEFIQAVNRELEALQVGRGRASSGMVGVFSRFDQQRRSLQSVKQRLDTFVAQVRAQVADQVSELRQAVAREAVQVAAYRRQFDRLAESSEQLLGPVATRTLVAVGERYDDLVQKADLGIIDVAWARKQDETERVNGLIRQMQERTQALEAEFEDVLKE